MSDKQGNDRNPESRSEEPGRDQPRRDYLEGFLFGAPRSANAAGAADADPANPAAADQGDKSPAKAGEDSLEDRVVEALRAIYDPEIPVNIYDLGLIYDVQADADAYVVVTMTLTTPHCPVAEIMPAEVEQKTSAVPGVSGASVNLVWDPPWDPSRMTEEAQLELGFI